MRASPEIICLIFDQIGLNETNITYFVKRIEKTGRRTIPAIDMDTIKARLSCGHIVILIIQHSVGMREDGSKDCSDNGLDKHWRMYERHSSGDAERAVLPFFLYSCISFSFFSFSSAVCNLFEHPFRAAFVLSRLKWSMKGFGPFDLLRTKYV